MKKGKITNLAAVLLLSVMSLGSCQTNDPYTITIWHTFGKIIQDNLEKHIKNFVDLVYEQDGIRLNIVQSYKGGYDDILDSVSKGLSTGNVPTIAVAYPDHVADYLYLDSSAVVNFDDYINDNEIGFGKEAWLGDKYGIEDFLPAYIEEGQNFVQEGTYVLPLMKSTEVMFYNTELVNSLLDEIEALPENSPYHMDRTRVTESATTAEFLDMISWDELMQIGAYAVAKDDNGDYLWSDYPTNKDEFYPVFYDSDGNLFITKMMQNEIPYSSVDYTTGSGKIDFEDEPYLTQAKDMVSELKDSYDAGVLTTKGCVGEYGSNYFIDENCIFSIGSSGGTGYQIPSSKSFTVGVCMVPADNNNPLYVCQGPSLCMLKSSSLTDDVNQTRNYYAWKFIKYLTNPTVNVELCTYGSEGYSPVRYSAYETDQYLDYLLNGEEYADTALVVGDMLEMYFTTAVFTGSAELRDNVGGIITEVLKKGTDIDTAFKTAIEETKLSMTQSSGGN